MVSVLGSRVGWTPARKEQMNKRTNGNHWTSRHIVYDVSLLYYVCQVCIDECVAVR